MGIRDQLRARPLGFGAVPLAGDDFTLISGEPKAFHYIAQSGKGLDRNFCPQCGARVFTSNPEAFPGTIFVMLGSLDNREASIRCLRCSPSVVSNGEAA